MLWDGLIILLIVTLAVAGWNVGIVNSWRGPFAIVIATVVSQQFYVDFATWVVQQLRVPPDQGVVIGYILLWSMVEIVSELLLSVLLPFNKKSRPLMFERAFGAGLGIVKALIVVLLPMIALTGPIKVPSPPADKSALINPLESGVDKAAGVNYLFNVAQGLSLLKPIVCSDKSPSFKPNFAGSTALDADKDSAK